MHLTEGQIIDYVLGVAHGERVKGAAHVAACAECHARAETYVRTLETVDNLPGPPEGYAEQQLQAVKPRLKPRR